jgi:hypothetical protein
MDKEKENPLLGIKEIQEMVKINAESSLRDMIKEGLDKTIKNMIINEADEEDYEEEDVVNDQNVETDEAPESDSDYTEEEETEEETVDTEETPVEDDIEVAGEEEGEDFSNYEVEDDSLDLTDASDESLIKVFKKVENDTEVEVTDTGDGKVEVSDNETGAEYIIDLDGLDESNLGYTTKYQKNVGINIPAGKGFKGNKPLGDKSSSSSKNVRPGTNKGNGKPFNVKESEDMGVVTEEEIVTEEDEVVDENVTRTIGHGRYRAKNMPQTAVKAMNHAKRGGAVRVGAQLTTSESKISQLEKQFSTLKEENRILKECVKQFKEAAQAYYTTSREVAMTNCKLAKAINLFTENATTIEEKQNILERLQNCKTEKEINSLHETIKSELKNRQPLVENINKGFDKQEEKTDSKRLYINEEVQPVLNLMERVLNVGK